MYMALRVGQNLNALGNLTAIFDKMTREGFLSSIQIEFEKIHANEFAFTKYEIQSLYKDISADELAIQLSHNMDVFQENFKIICLHLSELIS